MMRGDTPQEEDQEPAEQSGPSGKTLLIAAVVMVTLGYFLSTELRDMGRMQDCAMSGRTNCAPVAQSAK